MQIKKPNLDSVTTINDDGSKYNVHPADVSGSFTLRRRLTAWVLILVYILLPWIKINGFPAVFLDIEHRHFHFFGITLLTEDLWVLFFLISGLAFTLFVASSIIGRVWCGWFCPYTTFLEHIYRRIERLVEGDATKRRALDAAPPTTSKVVKRTIKWSLYILASLILANIFLSYFISLPQLWQNIADGPLAHFKEFSFIVAFTAIFSFCFGWFREQFCIILCPYGRFQSALTDDETITVYYDYNRGEPRGKIRKGDAAPQGDCIDCRRCVNVCPTGIDIRNGLQLECVACSSCIDACNDIMAKVNRPKGLIRYDSAAGIATGKRKIIRPRILLYLAFTMLGAGTLAATFQSKAKPFQVGITRMTNTTFSQTDEGIRNVYLVRITNKRAVPVTYNVTLQPQPGYALDSTSTQITLKSLERKTLTLAVFSPIDHYVGTKELTFTITSDRQITRDVKIRFLGPNARLYKESVKSKQP